MFRPKSSSPDPTIFLILARHFSLPATLPTSGALFSSEQNKLCNWCKLTIDLADDWSRIASRGARRVGHEGVVPGTLKHRGGSQGYGDGPGPGGISSAFPFSNSYVYPRFYDPSPQGAAILSEGESLVISSSCGSFLR